MAGGLAQIVAIFTARCDDVHAAREWILMEHVTSNEQYPRVFPAGCKVPIKMQILRRHLRLNRMVGRSLTDVFTRRGERERERPRREGRK